MKKILLLTGILFTVFSGVRAQQSAGDILQKKTEHQLQDIIKKSASITGLAAVDLSTGEMIFAHNVEMVFPQASAIKIPILMEVFKQAQEGDFFHSDRQAIDPDLLVGGTGILKHLEGELTWSIRNLSVLMIALSDNSATNILIDLVGMAEVNETLQEVGAEQTILQRRMMDIKASAQNRENLASPADAVHILQLLYDGEFISEKVSANIIEMLRKTPRSESRIAAGIPGQVSVAFKPGGLKGVSTEWAFVLLDERPYAVALMEN